MGRRDTLRSTGQSDAVEVNQRALIDKVLARYSGEFTVFRELLQNSDDAQSSEVEIRFETAEYPHRVAHSKRGNADVPPLPDLKGTDVTQWTFRNNGDVFTENDWSRLQRIADGNPDEEKIGAFGVGFYSLFSVTESPFVSSGGYGMDFYWKENNKDQLSVCRGPLESNAAVDPWTTFEIGLREAGPIPPAFDLLRFLASSITFMVHLNEVSVYFDEHRIGHIKKSYGDRAAIAFPIPLKTSDEPKLMNVTAVQSRTITIGAEIMHAVYGTVESLVTEGLEPRMPKHEAVVLSSPPKCPTGLHKTNVTLTAFTAEVDVRVNDQLTSEFIRSTKKKPRRKLEYHLIYTRKEDYEQSHAKDKDQPAAYGNIFQGLRADLNGATHTRIYIGHATGQTTGIGGHMASYFVPTVERESIDFVDKHLAVWNKELLYVGGLLARVAYESQLSAIHDKWTGATNSTPNSAPPKGPLQEDVLHILKIFEFHRSTPSPSVGELLAASFYGCSPASPRMLSSVGVREASTIKEYDPVLAKFLKNMPMLPQRVVLECPRAIQMLKGDKIISPVTFQDILDYLGHHHLNKEELVSCLRWWMSRAGHDKSNANMTRLLDAVVFRDVKGRILRLSSVRDFADPQTLGSFIPPDSPLPPSLLPHDISKNFSPTELAGFGWQQFTTVDWLRYISREEIMYKDSAHDFTRSPDWTMSVLGGLSRLWSSASDDARNTVKEVFTNRKCIPTSHGLCMPTESYLSGTNTGLFSNLQLPMVQFQDGLIVSEDTETVLMFIGVRKHIDPQLILKRMAEANRWDITGLIRYLCQVRKSLTTGEVTKLASSGIFMGESGSDPATRYCASELYAPVDDTFQQLSLHIIHLDEKIEWSDESDEAKLLFELGLRRYPSLDEIVDLCTSKNIAAVRTIAFQYLCKNLASTYSDCNPRSVEDILFIPAENNSGKHLERPGEVFLDKKWKALGFSVVQDDYVDALIGKLGVLEHPLPSKLLSHLTEERPLDEIVAREWFEILYDHISAFSPEELIKLGKKPVVPTNSSGIRDWSTPEQCYPGEGARDSFYSKLFAFVNFGSTANRFLNTCGARNEPTVTDVARTLVNDPERFHKVADGHDNFLTQLRNLAVNKRLIDNLILRDMRSAPILLGKKAMPGFQAWEHCVQERRSPKEIFIADDMNAYRLFREAIFVAPQEELLEDFYASLGCKRLSEVVQEQCKVVGNISDHDLLTRCSDIRMRVLESLTIFLHEFTHAKPKISLDWLSRVGNFKVKVCEDLSIHKTLEIEGKKMERIQEASAGAKRDDQGRIYLWVSRKALSHPDMDEVSTSLCRLLFGTVKLSESLLFSMILSSTREALERKGCRVDLILNKCRFDRDDLDEMKRDVKEPASRSTNSPELRHPNRENQGGISEPAAHILSMSTGQNPPQLAEPPNVVKVKASTSPASPQPPQPVPSPIGRTVPPTMPSAAGKQTRVVQGPETPHRTLTQIAQPTGNSKNKSKPGRTLFSRKRVQTDQRAIPRLEIQATVSKAIEACKPGADVLRREFIATETYKKSSNDHFCHDVTGESGFKPLGKFPVGVFQSSQMGSSGVQIFARKDHDTLMLTKKDDLDRFAGIVVPIAEAFGLPTESLNIFYDTKGSSIAFNQDGRLFLNLRYFEAWHDDDVVKGVVQPAQTSWFFALAHEIAHNMIKSHNSDHAFWFSKICEEYISQLGRILRPTTGSLKV